MQLSFYSIADLYYHRFVCPYIASAMITNPDAKVEVLVRGYNKFLDSYDNLMVYLQKEFGANMLIRSVDDYDNNIPANKLRYIVNPMLQANNYYITDIDFIFTQESEKMAEWVESELIRCKSFCTPYQRPKPNEDRVSGVLFVNQSYWDKIKALGMQSIKELSDVKHSDERFLMALLKKIDPNIIMDTENNRQIRTYHLSLNRKPFGTFDSFNPDKFKQLIQIAKHPLWEKLYPMFNRDFIDIFNAYVQYGQERIK